MVALIRVGHYLPVPGLDAAIAASSGAKSMTQALTGSLEVPGNIFMLSITPYMTASLFLAVLQVEPTFRRHLDKLRDEGRQGREQIMGYLSGIFVLTALTQAVVESGKMATGLFRAQTIINLMAGAVLCKWAVQTIDQWGLGDGTGGVIGAGIALSESSS